LKKEKGKKKKKMVDILSKEPVLEQHEHYDFYQIAKSKIDETFWDLAFYKTILLYILFIIIVVYSLKQCINLFSYKVIDKRKKEM